MPRNTLSQRTERPRHPRRDYLDASVKVEVEVDTTDGIATTKWEDEDCYRQLHWENVGVAIEKLTLTVNTLMQIRDELEGQSEDADARRAGGDRFGIGMAGRDCAGGETASRPRLALAQGTRAERPRGNEEDA